MKPVIKGHLLASQWPLSEMGRKIEVFLTRIEVSTPHNLLLLNRTANRRQVSLPFF